MSDPKHDHGVAHDDSVRDAGEPFAAEDADIIPRSSDNVDFRAHRLFLKHASPVFADMFALPAPPAGQLVEKEGDRVIVRMSEDSKSVKLLLSFCYAGIEPDLSAFEDLAIAVHIAMKFDMPAAETAVRSAIRVYAPAVPERVYALAWGFKSRELVLLAAKESLKSPFVEADRTTKNFPEFWDLPAGALQRLIAFQRHCLLRASQIHADLSWTTSPEIFYHTRGLFDRNGACQSCTNTEVNIFGVRQHVKGWFPAFIHNVATTFQKGIDLGALVSSPTTFECTFVSPCTNCGSLADVFASVKEFNIALRVHLEGIISEVRLIRCREYDSGQR